MGVIDVEVSDAGDLSPRLGVEALLCDVKGVECILFISLMDALGRTSSLNVVSISCRIFMAATWTRNSPRQP